jgi:pimeloyl-ACP methyl ester carboxylesterase
VYLVHGWGGRSEQFAALVEPLRRAGYTVVAFDAPSHGASDPGAWGPTSTTGVEFGKALDAVFMKFGRGEAVVAHSMGALSTLLACNHGWFGANRLVFVAPMAGYAEAMDVFQTMLGFGPRIRRRVDVRTWRRVGLDDDEFDVRNLWSGLDDQPPVLIVQDDTDPQAPYAESRALAEDIGAEFMTTTRLGHNRILADGEVARRIVRFLDADEPDVTLPAA